MKKIEKRKDIQIYRGVSVLSVIFYHMDSALFKDGFLGVDIFFVISGFVISNLIYSELSNNLFSLKTFYFHRFRRIFPSIITFIIFVQILIYFYLDHQFIYQTSKANLYSYLFISNIYFSQIIDYFNNSIPRNFVINLWSLSVEEQFYLIFPFIAVFTKKFTINKKIIIFTFFCLISIAFYSPILYFSISILKKIFFTFSNFIFYSPFTRVWQFSIGVISMFLNQKFKNNEIKISEPIFLILLSVFFVYITNEIIFFNKVLKLSVLMFLVCFFLIKEIKFKTHKNKLINFLIFTGNISYSLYLFHQPILASINNYNFHSIYKFEISILNGNYLNVLFVLSLIYLISYLNYFFIEKKYRSFQKFNFKNFKILAFLFLFSLILISLSFATNGYSFRDSEMKTFNKASELEFVEGTNYIAQNSIQCIDRDSIKDSCKFKTDNNKKIYIIGDSIMSSLVSGFVDNLDYKDYTIIEFTRGSCPLLINKCNFYEGTTKYNDILEIKNSIILLGGNYTQYYNSPTFNKDLLETVKIVAKNNTVYIFDIFPNPGLNIRMYKLINKSLPKLNLAHIDFEESIISNLKEAKIQNLFIINSKEIFCRNKFCKFFDNSKYYFIDHIHFSYFGADVVSKYLSNKYFNN